MEDVVLERMRNAIGWPAETGDGIFAPGQRNVYATPCKCYDVSRIFVLILLCPVRTLMLLHCALSCAVHCNRSCLFVCLFVCGSALLQPARSVCVASERFFI